MGAPAERKGKAAELQQQQNQQYGIQRVVTILVAWKLLLLAIACGSPGLGYDTSTQLFLGQHSDPRPQSWLSRGIEHALLRLTRWDGIYFASASLHGQVYEQEWAFSWALSRVTSIIARGVFNHSHPPQDRRLSTTSALQSSSRHFLSPNSKSTLSPTYSFPTSHTSWLSS